MGKHKSQRGKVATLPRQRLTLAEAACKLQEQSIEAKVSLYRYDQQRSTCSHLAAMAAAALLEPFGIAPKYINTSFALQAPTDASGEVRAVLRIDVDVEQLAKITQESITPGKDRTEPPTATSAPTQAPSAGTAEAPKEAESDSSSRLDLLRTAAKILEKHAGFTTPAENLIFDLLLEYRVNGSIYPEAAWRALSEYDQHFKEMVETSNAFLAQHQHLQAQPEGEHA